MVKDEYHNIYIKQIYAPEIEKRVDVRDFLGTPYGTTILRIPKF